MSSKYLFYALKNNDLTSIEKLIYICLSNRADENGKCFPSVSTIAQDANCSDRTVHRALKVLIEKKLVRSKPNYVGKNKRTSNTYTLVMTSVHPTPDTMAEKTIQYKQVLPRQYVTGTSLGSIAG
jgi:DNA-binding transcriptional regulator YhcF (GntR family)